MEKIDLRKTDYETLIEQRHEAGVNFVAAKAIADRYEEGTGEIKSRIMLKLSKEMPDASRNDLLDSAQATPEWSTFLDEKNEAKKIMLEYENLVETCEWQLKAKQSIMAMDREERKNV